MVGGPETVLLYIFLILLGAKLGGEAATRLRQPAVVGEIFAGILLGPSLLRVIPSFDILERARADGVATGQAATVFSLEVLSVLGLLGVLVLLFEVGLESHLAELRKVGASATLVGTFGVLFSLVVGAGVSYWLAGQVPWVLTSEASHRPFLLHLFIGATLTATSIGITARVLKELQRLRTREGQIILGAAVWDDVLGLVVLAVLSGMAAGTGGLDLLGAGKVLFYAVGFFLGAIALGSWLAPRLIRWVHAAFRDPFVHLGFGVTFMLLVAYLATWVGLAAIVGAFAAGLALSGSAHRHVILDHVKPVASLFVGFFFVTVGLRVDLSQATAQTWPLVVVIGLLLFVTGTLAKVAAGLGVVRTTASRYVVGVGMVPRGEVGLIFALFLLEHRLVENWQYTTLILAILLTTLVTPLWLKRLVDRFSAEPVAQEPDQARLADVEPSRAA